MTTNRKPITEPGPSNMEGTTPLDEPRPITAESLNDELKRNPPPAAPQQKALKQADVSAGAVSAFANMASFDGAQRMAKLMAASSLIPKEYQNNIPNAVIALEMAQRIGASPLAVMQNLYIVHGKPGWSAQFIIASLNSCGRYSPLRFNMGKDESGKNVACVASAIELQTGEMLEGPEVTMAMAKMEGWSDKNGSKWKTMPDLMLRYRAASFFGKLYAPDILMGMQSADELHDIIEGEIDDGMTGADDLNAAIEGKNNG